MTSFGHTGFTGTMAWADPNEIVYIFLSIEHFGDSTNKLSRENIREDIQEIIYELNTNTLALKQISIKISFTILKKWRLYFP
jgi:CubicO group peptidase (beta-lactamase class C family)